MATTGPAVVTSTSAVTSTSTVTGQGDLPIVRCLISFDAVNVSSPTYTDYTTRLRSYSTSRGRSSELSEFDAGSATVVLDDRDRTFDPNVNASVRPLNRLWLFAEFSGEVHDLFKGYAQSYNEDWDKSGIVDATTTIVASDEFMVLGAAALDTTNPPRDSYQNLAMDDQPFGYWDMNEDPASIVFQPLDTSSPQAPDPGESRGLIEFRRADRRAIPGKPRKHG